LEKTLVACLILTGIHVYFGIHVIARRVIFVDLALAQIAALGTVVGVAMGYEVGKDPVALYFYSLALTAAGALVFAVTKMRIERIPHEAAIGIVYCVAFAATLLLLAKSPLGPSEIDRILKGEILFVSWPTVLNTALIYAGVGAFHVLFRRRFFALSFGAASEGRMREILWDFLFYLSFGFVVTSSVAIAGVFLVFSYLVIPSAGAMLFTDRLWGRLAIGWTGAGIVSVVGVWLSHKVWDLPTSPLIVCLLAGALLVAVVAHGLLAAPTRRRTLIRLAAGGGGLAALVAGLFLFQKGEEDRFDHALHLLEARSGGERLTGLRMLASMPERRAEWRPHALALLTDEDLQVRRDAMGVLAEDPDPDVTGRIVANLRHRQADVRIAAARALGRSANPAAGEALLAAAAQEDEEVDVQLEMIDAALEKGLPGAVDQLFGLSANPLARLDAYKRLVTHLAFDFPHAVHGGVEAWWQSHRDRIRELSAVLDDGAATREAKRAAFEELRGMSERGFELADLDTVREWWIRNRPDVRWNPDSHRFEIKRE
jgi:zinc/manganese transport system permease protein